MNSLNDNKDNTNHTQTISAYNYSFSTQKQYLSVEKWEHVPELYVDDSKGRIIKNLQQFQSHHALSIEHMISFQQISRAN